MEVITDETRIVDGMAWHSVRLPRTFFLDPALGGCAPPGDNVVGDVLQGWLREDVLSNDLNEPNNDPSSATEIACPTLVNGARIDPLGDVDRYSFSVAPGTRIRAQVRA